MNNIIIIDTEPFSLIRKRNFFVEEFLSRGYNVKHYSLTNFISPPNAVHYTNTTKSELAFYLDTKKEIKKMLRSIDASNTFVFVELHFNRNTYFIFKYLYNLKLIWGRLSYYTNPAVNLYKRNTIQTIQRVKRYKSISYVKFALFVKLFSKRINKITQSHITFKTGQNDSNFPKSKKMITINYFDLEEYNLRKNEPAILEKDYIVFNDIYLPFHPDLQARNKGSEFINPTNYFKELNHFFDKIEKQYGFEVVIAAHPKANYSTEFGSRKVIAGQTLNLIKHCKLLITHLSISIDYALFSHKPVLFFHTPSLFKSSALQYMIDYMDIYATKIHTLVMNSESSNLPPLNNLEVDKTSYDEIVKNYFGELGSDKTNFEIVQNEIDSLLNSQI
ncbi:hypothetical protein [Epilithonimonas xixisoli]|uniref:Uncharacterized protein n=1 Tax=Epilithonimonas xixisoli TaxID=1476462 RepID=A0A4V3H2H6_9FLAO|nr:hypothetical protein [Epilithonimonas xixisoli]TDX84096.1 hypothetical protein B0I22_1692 [Epilithonimonas xixisoli]